jgi:hypothetical protein
MRQIWISKPGPPEVLVVKEAPDPQPASGELRIRVEASGVNFADIMGRLGLYPDLPVFLSFRATKSLAALMQQAPESTAAGLGATCSPRPVSAATPT